MSSEPPLLTLDQLLKDSMRSKEEAGIHLFFKLWRSSASLQLLILQTIKTTQLRGKNLEVAPLNDQVPSNDFSGTSIAKDVTESLIGSGIISPAKVNDLIQESYGGLTRKELLLLLEKHKAGCRSLGSYILVRWWKKSCVSDKDSINILLEQITLKYLSQAIAENREDFFTEIATILRSFKEEEYQVGGTWNHDPAHWWQFHLLLYILENPKEKYAMREFVKHFRDEVGENEMPTTKTIRSFCRKYGITLDSRPGAPKKLNS